MTFRKWTNVYGGTYATITLITMGITIVVAGELAAHPFWLHLLVGLVLFFVIQFTLSVMAWQFTERRRRKLDGREQA